MANSPLPKGFPFGIIAINRPRCHANVCFPQETDTADIAQTVDQRGAQKGSLLSDTRAAAKTGAAMTWTDFKKLTIKVNILAVSLGWLWLLWSGHGIAVSAVPMLILLTISGMILLSLTCFIACHSWLYWQTRSETPAVTRSGRSGLIALALGLSGWALVILASASGTEPADAITAPVVILSAICILYWFALFQKRYLRWFFITTG